MLVGALLRASRLPSEGSAVEFAAAEGSAARADSAVRFRLQSLEQQRLGKQSDSGHHGLLRAYDVDRLDEDPHMHDHLRGCKKRFALTSSVVSTDWWR